MLATLIPLLLSLSLAGLVLAVGLHAGQGDLLYVLRRPGELLKGAVAVIVIPPIVAAIIIAMTSLEPVVKAGIMLMAVSPVPPLVPGKELNIGGRKEYAYGLYAAMALLTIVSVPIVFAIASQLFGRDDAVSVFSIAKITFVGVIVPLGIGLLIRQLAPEFAEKAWKPVRSISMLLVLCAFAPILLKLWPAALQLVGNGTLAAMAAVALIAAIGGHLLGGPDPRDRATLAVASSVRHPGIAISIAGSVFQDPQVSAAILLFLLTGLVVGAVYSVWVKRQRN